MNKILIGVPCSEAKYESIVPCTREDEAFAVAAGMHLCGVFNTTVFMQNSGLGNCLDVITSLLKPYDIKINLAVFGGSDTPQHNYMNKYCHKIMKDLFHEKN
jgi:phosphonopyruvate decarboxylase